MTRWPVEPLTFSKKNPSRAIPRSTYIHPPSLAKIGQRTSEEIGNKQTDRQTDKQTNAARFIVWLPIKINACESQIAGNNPICYSLLISPCSGTCAVMWMPILQLNLLELLYISKKHQEGVLYNTAESFSLALLVVSCSYVTVTLSQPPWFMKKSELFHNLYPTSILICCMPSEKQVVSVHLITPGSPSQRLRIVLGQTHQHCQVRAQQDSNLVLSSTSQLVTGMWISNH